MKRQPHNPWATKAIKPFFWKTCAVCNLEFRREPGWLILLPGANHAVFEKFVCVECAPTLEDANKVRERWANPGPPPSRIAPTPPPPPMRLR